MESADNVEYLGLRHYRFYIRCPTCCAEIIWRTDLESGDYVLESGAKRNFEALKTAEELEAKRLAEEEEEIANNPMKLLEKRTDQSKQEMEMVEALEDLKQVNQRLAGMETDHLLLRKLWQEEEAQRKAEEEADEQLIKELLASRSAPAAVVTESSENDINELTKIVVCDSSTQQPAFSLQSGFTTRLVKPPVPSYLKRQLHGAILIRAKPTPTDPVRHSEILGSDSNVSGPSNAKIAKVSETSIAEDADNPLPGITYSDHSDSE